MSKSLGFSNIYNSSLNNSGYSSYDDMIKAMYNNGINNSGVQYVQNLPPNALNDAVTYNPNYLSDEDLYKRMWSNIKEYEDVIPYPYLDTKGNITTGGGANIDNYDDFMKVNFTVNGVPATDAQKFVAYHNLKKLSNQRDADGNYINRNRVAGTFAKDTNLRISDQDAYNMAQSHMTNDLAHVRSEFNDFDNFPNPLKEVLLDIQYNTGGLNRKNWPNLYQAIENRNLYGKNGIINNVYRGNVGQGRNDWATNQILSIKEW